ncbi:MAG: GDSL-type esterase/lipase family protein [Cyanobacteria bacterium P01_H01_bin.26]
MKLDKIGLPLAYLTIALLGTSAVLNFFLYGQLRKYYTELNQVRLDPLGLSYYDPTPRLQDKKDTQRVVLLGDSRAHSWPAPNVEGYEFINRGIAGETSAQTNQRFNYHLENLEPDIIVIQVGVNDLKAIPLMPEHRNLIVDLYRANIQQLIEKSKDLGATVVISTVLPVGDVSLVHRPVWSDEIGQAVYEVNGYIATLAAEQVVIFDGFSAIADDQGLMPVTYRQDELHLNQQGYVTLNEAFVEVLRTLGNAAPASQTTAEATR